MKEKLSVLDVRTGTVLGQAFSEDGVEIISYDPRLAHAYFPGETSGPMAIIGISTKGAATVLATVKTAEGVHCVASDDRGNAYVCEPRRPLAYRKRLHLSFRRVSSLSLCERRRRGQGSHLEKCFNLKLCVANFQRYASLWYHALGWCLIAIGHTADNYVFRRRDYSTDRGVRARKERLPGHRENNRRSQRFCLTLRRSERDAPTSGRRDGVSGFGVNRRAGCANTGRRIRCFLDSSPPQVLS